MASSGGVVVMVAAVSVAVTVAFAMSVAVVRMITLVVARMTVHTRRMRMAHVLVCGIVTEVVGRVLMGYVVVGRVVVARLIVTGTSLIMVTMAVGMVRAALSGQRPQGFSGCRTIICIVAILAFEPYRRMIVFALLSGAVRT